MSYLFNLFYYRLSLCFECVFSIMIAVLETGDTVYVISQKKIAPHPVNIISLMWEREKKGL